MLVRHMELLSDPRLPLAFVSFRDLKSIEGRVVAHGQDEATDRPYLLVEGIDAKVYLLYQNVDIQNARHEGKMGVNSFVTVEKQFANGQPFLQIEDIGDADALLKDIHYFENVQPHVNIAATGQTWGGWLGKYQAALERQPEKKNELRRIAHEHNLER